MFTRVQDSDIIAPWLEAEQLSGDISMVVQLAPGPRAAPKTAEGVRILPCDAQHTPRKRSKRRFQAVATWLRQRPGHKLVRSWQWKSLLPKSLPRGLPQPCPQVWGTEGSLRKHFKKTVSSEDGQNQVVLRPTLSLLKGSPLAIRKWQPHRAPSQRLASFGFRVRPTTNINT